MIDINITLGQTVKVKKLSFKSARGVGRFYVNHNGFHSDCPHSEILGFNKDCNMGRVKDVKH